MHAIPRFAEMGEDERSELWATLALRHCAGLGARSCKVLLEQYGTALAAYKNHANWAFPELKTQAQTFLSNGQWREGAMAEWDAICASNPHILLWNNASYPQPMREIPDSPLLLYCDGDVSLLSSPCLAIVGSRNASAHGCRVAAHLAHGLSLCGITIVSGMAKGIDSIAHKSALRAVGRSIGVLGTGLDITYPRDNETLYDSMRQQGLLLTEYAPATPPLATNFPIRNRLISGLCVGVIVVEAAERSGTLITARLALEQNRAVFVVPGPALDKQFAGCQKLVREGAHPVFTVDDVIRDLMPQLQAFGMDEASLESLVQSAEGAEADDDFSTSIELGRTEATQEECAFPATEELSPEQKAIVSYLQKGSTHIDEIALDLNLAVGQLQAKLLELEVLGVVKRLPGAHFALHKV